ncbi:MAG: hypothetical protein NT031_18980 [Planctomycetota bacterium]|nr:hypothetical protein [Planctomycetota bacterium]
MVLLILAIAAAALTLNFRPLVAQAQMSEVIADLGEFDRLTRTQATGHDRSMRLVVDVSGGSLRRLEAEGEDAAGRAMVLPPDYKLTRALVGRVDVAMGEVAIPCSGRGLTPTYALQLEGPGGRKQWLVFAGLTGQMIRVDNEEQVRNIWDRISLRDDPG